MPSKYHIDKNNIEHEFQNPSFANKAYQRKVESGKFRKKSN